jgi:hypothetical protein
MLDLILEVLGATLLIGQAISFFFSGATAFGADAPARSIIPTPIGSARNVANAPVR